MKPLGMLIGMSALWTLQAQTTTEATEGGWMDIDQLARVQVISVSKREAPLSETPAAVHIISGEDIRRSGAASLPEALRLAPGVDVARINSQRYAIGIRGFNSEFANKLLVLQDGRSLYSPQFGGTFWDVQDTLLEDVDRIEVVRGPGGTTWGVNAMNGVINILTKDARDTQGTLITGGGGLTETGFGGLRYGGQLGDHTYYRIYAKALARNELTLPSGLGAGDDWTQGRFGFRMDSHPSEQDHWTLQGDSYGGELLQYTGGAADWFTVMGGNLMGKWRHSLSDSAEVNAQLYFDSARRESAPATSNTDTWDLEINHQFGLGAQHAITWGLHYRFQANEAKGRIGHNYDPVDRTLNGAGLFLEDQWSLLPDLLKLSAGSKLEYNDFSGWEVLPNVRLAYTPTDRHTLWLAASRGIQSPAIADHDLTISVPGAPAFQSVPVQDRPVAELEAYEAGFRTKLTRTLTVDLAAFYNDYAHLATSESQFQAVPPTIVVTPSNQMYGESQGFEGSLLWQAAEWWRWRANYSLAMLHLHLRNGTTDTTSTRQEGHSPQQQVLLWSAMNFGEQWNLDTVFRFVDSLPTLRIPATFGLDIRLAYRPKPNLEFAVVGQNLTTPQHLEFTRSPGFPSVTEVTRGFYATFAWHF